MKFQLRIHAQNVVKIDEIIYCDPTAEKLNEVLKNILKAIEPLRNPKLYK